MTTEYLSLFVSWVESFMHLLLHHLLHSWHHISYPNSKMKYKSLFKNWVLHIPHRLRDLLWIVRARYSVAPIFFSRIMSRASSCVRSSQSLLKVITSFWHTFFEWMNPMIMEGHSKWLSQFCILYFFIHCFKLFFYLRDSCKVWLYGLYILDLHIFNCFLKVIFWFMFFPSNILVKESNISLRVFREDTCGIRWSLIESILLA